MRSEQQFAKYAFLGLLGLLALSQVAVAGPTVLNDWCVNVYGDTGTACNGAGAGGGSVNMTGFDTTLSPTGNALGSIVVALQAGQYASFYADYDMDFAAFGSNQDYATTVNASPSWGFEADDPNIPNNPNYFSDFSGNTPTNTNYVGTPSGPGTNGVCCDVSFFLSVSDAGTNPETVTFNVSDTAPSGFYIQQTNTDVGDSIYLSATESGGTSGPVIPEPSTLVLALLGGLSALMWRRLFAA